MELEVTMNYNNYRCIYSSIDYDGYFNGNPYRRAVSYVSGGPLTPDIQGVIVFVDVPGGTEAFAEIYGLPLYKPADGENPPISPFGFHIHENGTCEVGDAAEPFTAAGEHWNPTNQPHGNHAGDFPVLFSNDGYARMSFFTDKFKIPQIIGKTVIIHESPDDYRTQPSGASGKRLACGVIYPIM